VKRVCIRLKRARGIQAEDVAIPVETRPGEVAQVDFGYVGRLYDPRARTMRKAWVARRHQRARRTTSVRPRLSVPRPALQLDPCDRPGRRRCLRGSALLPQHRQEDTTARARRVVRHERGLELAGCAAQADAADEQVSHGPSMPPRDGVLLPRARGTEGSRVRRTDTRIPCIDTIRGSSRLGAVGLKRGVRPFAARAPGAPER
jgi:hypothetical protein